jgi:hypothetical protein
VADLQSTEMEQVVSRLRQLENELARMRDREEIVECLHRYPRGLDRHDSDVLASVFHEDARLHYGPDAFIDGPTTFVPWANAFHDETWAAHTHLVDVNSVEVDGDVAHTHTYVFFSLRRKDGETIDVGCGRYIDRLERRGGQWKIAAREMLLEWRGTVDAAPPVPNHAGGTWDRTDPSYQRPLEVEFADEFVVSR